MTPTWTSAFLSALNGTACGCERTNIHDYGADVVAIAAAIADAAEALLEERSGHSDCGRSLAEKCGETRLRVVCIVHGVRPAQPTPSAVPAEPTKDPLTVALRGPMATVCGAPHPTAPGRYCCFGPDHSVDYHLANGGPLDGGERWPVEPKPSSPLASEPLATEQIRALVEEGRAGRKALEPQLRSVSGQRLASEPAERREEQEPVQRKWPHMDRCRNCQHVRGAHHRDSKVCSETGCGCVRFSEREP